jgi:HTH-type transcriptional repressor of NAD biosynthesis genes
MARYAIGLVVGKFAPLHRGHEALIAFAQSQCEQLLVLSYTNPEFEPALPAQRRAWLQAVLPQVDSVVIDDAWLQQRGIALRLLPNDAPDAAHQQFLARLLRDGLGRPVDALFASEHYVHATAALLAQAFGRPVAAVPFDPVRAHVPISASRIRAEPHRHRRFLDPRVYASFVSRIALVGGESTGKTTLARDLAAHYGGVWAAEYGRELWEEQAGVLNEADLLLIARTQVAREDALLMQAHQVLACDTTPLVTQCYADAMFGRCDDELRALSLRPYAHWFLCEPDFPLVQDGTRRDEAFRQWQHRWYEAQLAERGIAFTRLTGTAPQRLALMVAVIGAVQPTD